MNIHLLVMYEMVLTGALVSGNQNTVTINIMEHRTTWEADGHSSVLKSRRFFSVLFSEAVFYPFFTHTIASMVDERIIGEIVTADGKRLQCSEKSSAHHVTLIYLCASLKILHFPIQLLVTTNFGSDKSFRLMLQRNGTERNGREAAILTGGNL